MGVRDPPLLPSLGLMNIMAIGKKKTIKDIPIFGGEVKSETAKVTWPSRRETTRTTLFVFIFAVISSIYFSLVDMVIYKSIHWAIG